MINLIDPAGTVVRTTTSGTDGAYSFANLTPGTYRVEMVVPGLNYGTMYPEVGVAGGTSDGVVDQTWSAINVVDLKAGEAGTSYNFGLYEQGM